MKAPMRVGMLLPPLVAEPVLMVVVVVPPLVADFLPTLAPLISHGLPILDALGPSVGERPIADPGPITSGELACPRAILQKLTDGGAGDPGRHAGANTGTIARRRLS
jgi:hypothetical protein